MRKGRLASALAIVAISAAACTGDGIGVEFGSPASPSASTVPPESPSDASGRGVALDVAPVDTGEARALAAMRALCEGPVPTSTDDDGAPRETPADVAELESQVEQVRELEFLREGGRASAGASVWPRSRSSCLSPACICSRGRCCVASPPSVRNPTRRCCSQ